ncbi:unnamed protein product [Rotaria socialis]|uniref:Uncharacterized protein n=1 Tax=Rotaria socialis TaxID=392032 RepID=A0A821FHZ8_9BILA|nr:unnamed protein product [Rotaria socialis]CAF3415658.1 unnamed protein product [Rotaria socialis]CAF4216907.1 unnamed protein product [Rotaria socialis]CAF4650119.1 unnamed protein product [Rotaria socialis]
MLLFYFFLLFLSKTCGKFLSASETSSLFFIRNIRLSTNDQQYLIQCPYGLNHLRVQLFNYSNENCFNLYSVSNNNPCVNHLSPCQFHAKRIPLRCNRYLYSKNVDITYQCSNKEMIFSNIKRNSLSNTSNPSNSEENMALFLIGLCTIIIFWVIIFAICYIYYCNDHEECDLLFQQTYLQNDIIDFNFSSMKNHSMTIDNLCLRVNPFENNHITT